MATSSTGTPKSSLNARLMKAFDEHEQASMKSLDPQQMLFERVTRCPFHQNEDGSVTIFGHEDLIYINRHRSVLGTGNPHTRGHVGGTRPLIPLELDGPEHLTYRRLLDPMFTAKKMAELEPSIRRRAHQYIDDFIADGSVDAYNNWCQPLPAGIFMDIMGLPAHDTDFFMSFKDAMLGHGYETVEALMEAMPKATQQCREYFREVFEQGSRDDSGGGLVGELMRAELDGQPLDLEIMLDITHLLMLAGLDTVASTLALYLGWLARNPDARRQLVADPSLWPGAVEELIRYETPVHQGHRMPTEDITLPSGYVVPANTLIHTIRHSANLDPQAFDDPLDVRFDRESNSHAAFGTGYHRCLGSNLARLELRVAMEVWHERIPDYRLVEGAPMHFDGMNPRVPDPLWLEWTTDQ